jgi:hypothetical protein
LLLLPPLFGLDVPVDVPVVVVVGCIAPLLAQKPVYQLWTALRASGVPVQAASQGPAVVVE